jgi:hypothetical protein
MPQGLSGPLGPESANSSIFHNKRLIDVGESKEDALGSFGGQVSDLPVGAHAIMSHVFIRSSGTRRPSLSDPM